MSSRNNIALSLAESADSTGVRQVFDSMSFDGKISVRFARNPDPLSSISMDGTRAVVAVFRDLSLGEKIIGLGACVVRAEYVGGSLRTVGYLTGMKLLPEYRGKSLPIAAAYRLIRQNTPEVELYYTTILKENTAAQALLEKRRRSMPVYHYQGLYRVYCISGARRAPGGLKAARIEMCDKQAELQEFYAQTLPARNFSCPYSFLKNQPDCMFYVLRGQDHSILSACAVWNQQAYKQYVIEQYGGAYRLLRHLPLELLGYPKFSAPGAAVNYASIALLQAKDNNLNAMELLLRKICAQKRFSLLFVGVDSGNVMCDMLDKFPHIAYESRLYSVLFDDASAIFYENPSPEVALL